MADVKATVVTEDAVDNKAQAIFDGLKHVQFACADGGDEHFKKMNNCYAILKILECPILAEMMMTIMMHAIHHCPAFQQNTMNKLKNHWVSRNKSHKAANPSETADEEMERFETFFTGEIKLSEPDGKTNHKANGAVIDELTETMNDMKDDTLRIKARHCCEPLVLCFFSSSMLVLAGHNV